MAMFQLAAKLALLAGLFHAVGLADCRLLLADQSDWAHQLGFYLDLEATTAADGRCHLDALTMFVGVADGANWRYPRYQPAWQYDHRYQVQLTFVPAAGNSQAHVELMVDGATIPLANAAGGFTPVDVALSAGVVPSWAASPSEFMAVQGDLTATTPGGSVTVSIPGSDLPVGVLRLAGHPVGSAAAFQASTTGTMVFETSFILRALPTTQIALIDRYGQSIYSPWSGKLASDDELHADDIAEQQWLAANPAPGGLDAWGGLRNAGWSLTGTGYYTTTLRNGYWWLISPDGNPVFYTGVCTAPNVGGDSTPVTGRPWLFDTLEPDAGATSALWGGSPWGESGNPSYYSFPTANLIRKYGADWAQSETDRTAQRVQSWGFTGLGKWGSPVASLPILPVMFSSAPTLAGHMDPFDTNTQSLFASDIGQQVKDRVNNPSIVGWSFQNEYDGIVPIAEIQNILSLGAASARLALMLYSLNTIHQGDVKAFNLSWGTSISTSADVSRIPSGTQPSSGELEPLRRYYENALHQMIYRTFKQADPNHLYFSFWIVPGWWADPADWQIAAANCDVLGFDRYAFSLLEPDLLALLKDLDKPALIGEFSFPPHYGLERGFAVYAAANAVDEASAGDAYARFVFAAASEPHLIGTFWFEYRDEPLTGRGPGFGSLDVYGEDYAFGLIDVTDRPKYDLVKRMHDANVSVGTARLLLTDPAPRPPRIRPPAPPEPPGAPVRRVP
jgi:hypothetical protein